MTQQPHIDVDLQQFVSLFAATLKKEWKCKKTPSGIVQQWKNPQPTAKIFLRASFPVWVAYWLTGKRCNGQKHYQGQFTDQATYAAFESLSESRKAEVASALCEVQIHGSVLIGIELVKKALKVPERSRVRRSKSAV